MKRSSLLIPALCFSLLAAACGDVPQKAVVGMTAPDFSLVDRNGKTWTLSELRGKVVFVNFWATWCPPCREEMPSMQRLYAKMPKDKFEMLAILENDKPERAEAFAAKLGITLPILYDEEKVAWPKYGLTGLPETYIVDKWGVLREKFIGPAQWDSPRVVQMMMNYINE
jgi:peroxiredoxin